MDPRLEAVPRGNYEKMSPLMYAKAKSKTKKVNACPFGCRDQQLDQHGYCRHLVGFTVPEDEQWYYPQKMGPNGRRIVLPRTEVDEELSCEGEEPILKCIKEPVKPGDLLVKITTCSRVYRDVPLVPKEKKQLAKA